MPSFPQVFCGGNCFIANGVVVTGANAFFVFAQGPVFHFLHLLFFIQSGPPVPFGTLYAVLLRFSFAPSGDLVFKVHGLPHQHREAIPRWTPCRAFRLLFVLFRVLLCELGDNLFPESCPVFSAAVAPVEAGHHRGQRPLDIKDFDPLEVQGSHFLVQHVFPSFPPYRLSRCWVAVL